MKTKTLSLREYAKSIGVSRQAVLQRTQRGTLPPGVKAKKVPYAYGFAWVITIQENVKKGNEAPKKPRIVNK